MRIDFSQVKKEQVLGAILVITVLGVGTLYSSDIYRLLLTHPDQDLFVIHQPEKDEINVIQRTGYASYNRYRVTEDEICQYQGRSKIACYRWYLDYYRTYGEDEWVSGLWRKKSLILMTVDESEERVYVRRVTPYYGYTYAGGSDGEIIERLNVFQDHTDFKVEYYPERKTLHRLRMKVTNLKSSFIPFDFGDQTTIRFDDDHNFVFQWDGAGDLFDHHELDGDNLWLWFKPQKGEIHIG